MSTKIAHLYGILQSFIPLQALWRGVDDETLATCDVAEDTLLVHTRDCAVVQTCLRTGPAFVPVFDLHRTALCKVDPAMT